MTSAVCSVAEMGTGKCFSSRSDRRTHCTGGRSLGTLEARRCHGNRCSEDNNYIPLPIPRSTPLFMGSCDRCCGNEYCRGEDLGSGKK